MRHVNVQLSPLEFFFLSSTPVRVAVVECAKTTYIGGQLVYCVGMILMAVTRHKVAVILLSPTAGVMYATLFTMPYLLIAHYKNTYRVGAVFCHEKKKAWWEASGASGLTWQPSAAWCSSPTNKGDTSVSNLSISFPTNPQPTNLAHDPAPLTPLARRPRIPPFCVLAKDDWCITFNSLRTEVPSLNIGLRAR
ncbi:hypothetical protein CEXT_700821 [Caerostris extrusa]|uniref:Uncharacterized protein n=1 Tax=Caerostris extrusa TaxID=172846 RepID=A0AAV4U327_CAEEX|nr:hypothetical protein CEXT_700821 [Caerostris extrusa]